MEFINNITKNLPQEHAVAFRVGIVIGCLLYTSDAADE